MALGQRGGREVIISGGFRPGAVRAWDLESGHALGERLRGHDNGVDAVAFGSGVAAR